MNDRVLVEFVGGPLDGTREWRDTLPGDFDVVPEGSETARPVRYVRDPWLPEGMPPLTPLIYRAQGHA